MLYTIAERRYFKETGKTLFAGQTVELPEDVASEIIRNEGPVLKAVSLNTQAAPTVIRVRKPRKQS